MKKVKILGAGCPSCHQLAADVEAVIAAEGIDATVEKVDDLQQIMAYKVMSTPAIVIDEKVVCKGCTPSREDIKGLLTNDSYNCCCGNHGAATKHAGGCCS